MTVSYPACFFKENDGRFSVIFPDIPGGTYGDDIAEAREMAVDMLAGYITYLNEENLPLPKPSDINNVDPSGIAAGIDYTEYEDVFVETVSVDVDKYSEDHF